MRQTVTVRKYWDGLPSGNLQSVPSQAGMLPVSLHFRAFSGPHRISARRWGLTEVSGRWTLSSEACCWWGNFLATWWVSGNPWTVLHTLSQWLAPRGLELHLPAAGTHSLMDPSLALLPFQPLLTSSQCFLGSSCQKNYCSQPHLWELRRIESDRGWAWRHLFI